MKKNFLSICLAAFVALTICSCSTTEQFPKYVPIDKMLSVPLGSSYDDVVKYLGCPPLDLVSRQKDGYSIYQFKYRIFYRDLDPRLFDQRGSETAGPESYYGDLQDAFLFFKGDKLMDIQTVNGLCFSADWVLINNTLYNISKDGIGYNLENLHRDRSKDLVPGNKGTNEGKPKLPFMKGKN